VRQGNVEKAILETVPPALIHQPNQIVERLHYQVRQFRRVKLITVFACKLEFTRDTAA
jgi:hypothetical protein